MKRTRLIISVLVLTMIMAVTAVAAPSPSALGVVVDPATVEIVAQNVRNELQEALYNSGLYVVMKEATPVEYENKAVVDAVKAVNSDKPVTVLETVEALKDVLPDNFELTDDGVLTIESADGTIQAVDLNNYDFVASEEPFKDLVLTDGHEVVIYSGKDDILSVKAKVIDDGLKGVKVEDLHNYKYLQINTADASIYFVDLDEESFNSEEGSDTVVFQCLGATALIQNTENLSKN